MGLDCEPVDVPMGVKSFCQRCWKRKPVSVPNADTVMWVGAPCLADECISTLSKHTALRSLVQFGVNWPDATVAPGCNMVTSRRGTMWVMTA